ncbi:restriction endonuclease subunit S [Bradyrhizobium sp. BRP20]|uniref:restriction endonuclease subunit S n=1 Tax=Bradyrhizobium sp. BRP20 TaxID=2793822 RepID=UPI001CD5701F|nr:restriction endonuclease subunit S [Bradyrhizobium sp. BRP20]MCA1435602.1 restriction endonuclease subunit S [Bradyrhizobium sp. BRP20]
MNDWQRIRLGDAIELFDHIRVPLNSRERETRPGPFPYYGAQGVIDHIDGFLFEGRYLLIPEDGENLNSRKQPIAFFAEGKFWVNNHAHIVRARTGVADDVFLKQWLNNADIRPYVTGAAQPKLSQANLRRIEILLPPLHIQCRIASILGAYDELIEVNRRRIALLEEMARRLFEEWFIHFRFPGHEDIALVETPDGPLPKGWQRCPLEEMLVLQRGFDLPSSKRREGPYPVISASGKHGTHSEAKVQSPGIVTGRSGTIGNVMIVHEDHWPLNTTLYIREFRKAPPAYALHLLRGLDLASRRGGAAVPTLNRNHLHNVPVVCPPADLIARYERVALTQLRAAHVMQQQQVALAASRDLLLPRLVSGELSIGTAERELEAVA